MKDREEHDALDCGDLNVFAKALTFSPSIRAYAGKQGANPHPPGGHLPPEG